ncbi:type III pantothenate kinase [Sungkyunkwania multivorans]|uniref:Type III pantothenate kinase n=1 Tax=Sungkyunkwania multivorans TaxID=1173618 RepID=A0ABW3D3K3_9FLAO
MNLIIDAGNTTVKVAVFKENTLFRLERTTYEDFSVLVNSLMENYDIRHAIISSVGRLTKDMFTLPISSDNIIWLSHKTPLPFINSYTTPYTLGVDRIALMAAATVVYPKKNVLVIDAGTCVTFDFKDENEVYIGGSIAPGLQMRFNAMHQQTAKLPLLYPKEAVPLIGASTSEAMQSGVVNGISLEIDGVISQYLQKFEDLTVILTGGDAVFLSKTLKNTIFAHSNFLLQGLYSILEFNKNR